MHWRDNFVKELCIVGLSGTAEVTPPSEEKQPKRKATGRSVLPPASPSKSRSTTAVLVGSARTTSRTSTYRSIPRFYGGPQLASAPSVASSKNFPDIRDTQQLGLHGTSKEIHGQSENNWSGSVSQYSSRAYTCKTQTDGRDADLKTELNSLPTTDTGGIAARRAQSRARSEPVSSQMQRALEFRPNIVIKPLKPKLDSKDLPSPNEMERTELALFNKVNQHFRLDDKGETPRKIVTPRLFGSPRGTQPEAGFERLLTMKSIYRSSDQSVPPTPPVQSYRKTEDIAFSDVKRNDRKFVLDLRQLSKKHTEKQTDLDMIKVAEQANMISVPPRNDSNKIPQQELSKENLVNNWLDTCPVDAPKGTMLVDEKVPVITPSRKQIILNVPNIGQEAE